MPRSQVRKSARSTALRIPKQYLLPLPDKFVRDASLACHLALTGCTSTAGGLHSLNEVIRATYLSFLLWDAGYGPAEIRLFHDAEAILGSAVMRARGNAEWRLEESEVRVITKILKLHDEQIAAVPTHVFLRAETRLATLLKKEVSNSPIERRLGCN